MLKLTDWRDRGVIYIAPAHIVGIESTSKGSRIIVPGAMFTVCEKPAEIMNMPEMVKHLNPMFRVDAAPYEPFPGMATTSGEVFRSVGEFSRAVERKIGQPRFVADLGSRCGTPHHSIDEWNRCAVCNPAKREL